MGRAVHQEPESLFGCPPCVDDHRSSLRRMAVSHVPRDCNGAGGTLESDQNPAFVAPSRLLGASSAVSQDSVERLVRNCLMRLPHRSVPPSWSGRDWREEIEQVVALAMMRALND